MIIIAMALISMILVLNFLYFYFKTNKALLVFQQGGYNYTRMFSYIKDNYKYTYGINELCLIIAPIIVIIRPELSYISVIIMMFFSYYNLRFYNLNAKRYDVKLKLNITSRVKRLIFTFFLINLLVLGLSIYLLKSYGYNFLTLNFYAFIYLVFIILTYVIFINVMLANLINAPIEKAIKRYYKNRAKKKLQSFKNLEVIGITGSFGKTSTKNIVGTILSSFAPTLITPESYNTPMGLTITIDKYLTNLHRYFIAEMGAYKRGEIKELCDLVKPKYGIVTSVGSQHLETFKSIDNVLNTKMELIENLPSDGLGIINIDNEYIKNYQIKNNVRVKTYSLTDSSADIYGYDIKYLDNGMHFKFSINNQEYEARTKLLGKYNVENILAGILIADHLNLDINDIISTIAKIKPVKNRLEFKVINNNTIIIDDAFNANELGIKESIKILGQYQDYQRILITPGLIDLGSKHKEIHVNLGEYLTKYCDQVYIVGNYNYDSIYQGILNTDFDTNNVINVDNFMQAYNQAMSIKDKKIILIANDLPDKFNS